MRRTYAATHAPERELLCWEEVSQPGSPTGGDADASKAVKPHRCNWDSEHPVVHLQDLSIIAKRGRRKDTTAEGGLLAIHADGQFRLLTEDLKAERWSFSLPRESGDDATTVVYAASTSIATAKKALLRDRQDAVLPEQLVEGTEVADHIILFLVVREAERFSVRIILVPTVVGAKRARQLLSLPLPNTGKLVGSRFSVYFPTGTLYHLSARKLATYDLTSTQPALASTIEVATETSREHPPSILRTSPSTVLIATHDSVSLYDTKFSSIQARVQLQAPGALVPKDKDSQPSTPAAPKGRNDPTGLTLTTYVQSLNMAVGYSQKGITAVQISRTGKEDIARKFEKESLLIDSLGCGVQSSQGKAKSRNTEGGILTKMLRPDKEKTEKAVQDLATARKAGDVAGFDRIFAEYLGYVPKENTPGLLKAPEKQNQPLLTNGVNDHEKLINGENSHDLVMMDNYSPEASESIPEKYYKSLRSGLISSILSMVFSVVPDEEGSEKQEVSFFPPNVMKYLLESGNFSTLYLPVKEGLVNALSAFDPSFRTLQWFLSLGDLPVSEAVRAIEIALSKNKDGGDDVVYEVHRTEVLRLALLRLATFPTTLIIKSLKGLPGDSILTLVALLRNELALVGGGFDGGTIGFESTDSTIISELLTATLDAVGIGNIAVFSASELLGALESNVNMALQGVEEAIVLKGIFDEVFRHVDWKGFAAAEEAEQERIQQLREKNQRRRARKEKNKADAASAALGADSAVVPTSLPEEKPAPMSLPEENPVSTHLPEEKSVATRAKGRGRPKRRSVKQRGPTKVFSARDGARSMLPLGPLALRKVIDPLVGKEVIVTNDEWSNRRRHWRDALEAGVYSIETMVI